MRRAEVIDATGLERLHDVIRDYALAIASDYGWCMVRAEDQDLGPETGRHIRRSSPRSTRASAG